MSNSKPLVSASATASASTATGEQKKPKGKGALAQKKSAATRVAGNRRRRSAESIVPGPPAKRPATSLGPVAMDKLALSLSTDEKLQFVAEFERKLKEASPGSLPFQPAMEDSDNTIVPFPDRREPLDWLVSHQMLFVREVLPDVWQVVSDYMQPARPHFFNHFNLHVESSLGAIALEGGLGFVGTNRPPVSKEAPVMCRVGRVDVNLANIPDFEMPAITGIWKYVDETKERLAHLDLVREDLFIPNIHLHVTGLHRGRENKDPAIVLLGSRGLLTLHVLPKSGSKGITKVSGPYRIYGFSSEPTDCGNGIVGIVTSFLAHNPDQPTAPDQVTLIDTLADDPITPMRVIGTIGIRDPVCSETGGAARCLHSVVACVLPASAYADAGANTRIIILHRCGKFYLSMFLCDGTRLCQEIDVPESKGFRRVVSMVYTAGFVFVSLDSSVEVWKFTGHSLIPVAVIQTHLLCPSLVLDGSTLYAVTHNTICSFPLTD